MTMKSSFIMVAVLAGATVWAGGAGGAVRYVALDGSGSNGLNWETAYQTIQAAVDDPSLGNGDEIRVKYGTYVLSTPVQVEKAVNIYGGYSGSGSTRDWQTYQTVLDCEGEAKRGFDIYANARVDGFLITDGHSWGIPPWHGGGIWIQSCAATVANCTFYRNYSENNGGAIATLYAHGTTISSCTFIENTAAGYGGAIYNDESNLTITGCVFTDNVAQATADGVDPNTPIPGGGAIFNEGGQPTISDCMLDGNSGYYGGGINNYFSNAIIQNCTLANGDATAGGGGMYAYGGSATILSCLFQGNTAGEMGGGVLDVSTSDYINCIFTGNVSDWHGGGVYLRRSETDAASEATLTNCTIYGNDAMKGGGVYVDNITPTMVNSIVWANTAPSDVDGPGVLDSKSLWSGAGLDATYCNIQGYSTFPSFGTVPGVLVPGEGNILVDPQFSDPAGGDFELRFGSPCIDAGTDSAPALPTYDYAGKPRIADGNEDGVAQVDMGALEYRGRYISDYLFNARIFQTDVYDSPADAVATKVFLLEVETSDEVEHVKFRAPSGFSYTIPNAPYMNPGSGVETYHRVVDGIHLWGYRAETGPVNPMINYGDGTYELTVYYYTDGSQQQTDLWYGIPNTSTTLEAPSQIPNVISPSYGGTTGSPAVFTWEPCTDTNANHVSVTVVNIGGETILTDLVGAGETMSNPLTMDEGMYSAEVAFEHSYQVINTDAIPFDYGKAVLIGHEFEVVFNTIYRFWSPMTSRHFYTISVAERDHVIATYPEVWSYEGPVFHAYATSYADGAAAVYRFWSSTLASHFYTISAAEKDAVIAKYPTSVWQYEGIGFYAFPPEGQVPVDAMPVYRFWNERESTHFYTISEAEKDHVLDTYAHFLFEGIAFYAYE